MIQADYNSNFGIINIVCAKLYTYYTLQIIIHLSKYILSVIINRKYMQL